MSIYFTSKTIKENAFIVPNGSILLLMDDFFNKKIPISANYARNAIIQNNTAIQKNIRRVVPFRG
jgi:hypothetical protein